MSMQCVSLRDEGTGTQADILVGFGLNCFRFQCHLEGQPVDVIWSEEGFETGDRRPSGSGIPILFPFPGRIQGTQFLWEGHSYTLAPDDGRGNAIHGFVHHRPWRVLDKSPQHVTAQFQASSDAPELRQQWPADFRLTVTYRISGCGLMAEFLAENPGAMPLPFGLGTHPYFRLPLGPSGTAGDCRVSLPVSEEWELLEMNATGRRLDLENADQLRRGVLFQDLRLDNVFSGLQSEGGRCVARIDDPNNRRWVRLDFAASFRECVVYTPGSREAICIEPYTCVPDCFRLHTDKVDAGLRILQPGERFQTDFRIEVGEQN